MFCIRYSFMDEIPIYENDWGHALSKMDGNSINEIDFFERYTDQYNNLKCPEEESIRNHFQNLIYSKIFIPSGESTIQVNDLIDPELLENLVSNPHKKTENKFYSKKVVIDDEESVQANHLINSKTANNYEEFLGKI